jgi:Flp pilus assembly pilin Flp
MRAKRPISDRLLYWQVAAENGARGLADRAKHVYRDQRGQTPTEYLMIVGLMAAVIVLVFVTFYWDQVKGAAQTWVKAVKEAILGQNIKK